MGRPLWDANRHEEYVRQRDAAIQRQADEREGTTVARDIDATWASVPADERQVLEYLVLTGARCCVGRCADPLLARLVAKGMLSWPSGVRPVLTDDLETVFIVPPALWTALEERRAALFAPLPRQAAAIEQAARIFAGRLTPVACADPLVPSATTPGGRAGKCSTIARATLLVSARFDDSAHAGRPLSLSEYHHLVRWLDALGLTPAVLLRDDVKTILQPYPDHERILALLGRTAEIEALLDHWEMLGIWVLAERDAEFPARLRERLKSACLPLLFGAGPRAPLDQGGLCVVGSRDSPEESRRFAQTVGERSAAEGIVVISSDMRGIDRDVLSATFGAGGRAICVLSNSLEKAVSSNRFRPALAAGRATLVTPFNPDVHFAVANAMRANRYQYALSDAAIVVEARQSGGIWSGADENRKHRWVPAFVRTGANVSPGNSALLHLGLLPITQQEVDQSASLAQLLVERASQPPDAGPARRARRDLFAVFLSELVLLDDATARSEESVACHFGIELEQARVWLARAQLELANRDRGTSFGEDPRPRHQEP